MGQPDVTQDDIALEAHLRRVMLTSGHYSTDDIRRRLAAHRVGVDSTDSIQTPINLAAIEMRNEERRRLRDAATPGPWRLVPREVGGSPYSPRREVDCEIRGNAIYSHDGTSVVASTPVAKLTAGFLWYKSDKAFFVHARTDTAPEDIAALVAEVVRLRTLLNQVSAGIYKNGSGDRRLGAYVNGVWLATCDVDEGDAALIEDWRLRRDAALTTTTSE